MPEHDSEWYKALLEAMRDMVLVKGPRSQLLWANKAFRDYYGMTEAELLNIVDAPHSDPDNTMQYVIDDQKVFDTAADLDIPREDVTDADGNVAQFHTVKSPIFQDGQVVRSIGVSRRIEDGTVFRREISHAEAKAFVAPLKAVIQSFPIPMLMVDVKKRVVSISPLWIAGFGDCDPGHDTFFADAFPVLKTLDPLLDNAIIRGVREVFELDTAAPRGRRLFHSFQISPWRFANGEVGGATLVATDVSDLHEKTRFLERANDELTQFSYRASHDLKGPLSTIKGLASFMIADLDDGDTEEARANADKIRIRARKLENTVTSILDLTRADLKSEIAAVVDPNAMLDEICAGLELQITRSNIDIQRDLQVSELFCEGARVQQILENLISNAIKYRSVIRPQSFVRITVEENSVNYRFSIIDNGIGIPEGKQDQAFEMFSRFHNEVSEGSGLGLAIVKRHVDAMNGDIQVRSSPEGTRFTVDLPKTGNA